MRISANLGFLFRDRPLAQAIGAAHAAGFGAVELHWPHDEDPLAVARLLEERSMPLLCVNTPAGDVAAGEFGLSALPGQEARARAAIDRTLEWARLAGAANIHVMAGRTADPNAFATFAANLSYARDRAAGAGIGILVEPLNGRDVPGYFLRDLPTARRLCDACGPEIRIMFDCYHRQIEGGDLLRSVESHLDAIGHIQFAAVPDRAEPDHGEIDYRWLLPALRDAGYAGWFGAEYKPVTGSLAWLETLRDESN